MPQYRLLGPVEVGVGTRWSAVKAPRQRALLAILLCRLNRLVTTGELVEGLWEDDPPAAAVSLLAGYVWRLRRTLGDPTGEILVTRPGGYKLQADPSAVDAQVFETLAREGRERLEQGDLGTASRRLRAALALWRGAALADVPPTTPATIEKTRLEEARLAAVEHLVEAELGLGQHEELVPYLRSAVSEHPLRERLQAQLMVALYRSGRRADALAAYQLLRRTLVEELGIEPGQPLRELQERMLRGDDALDFPPAPTTVRLDRPVMPVTHATPMSKPVHQLPPASAAFAGRQAELRRVVDQLVPRTDRRHSTVVAINGPGGVGKSALGIRAAHEAAAHFPDGQLYADLTAASAREWSSTPQAILEHFVCVLGMERHELPNTLGELSSAFRSLVHDRRLLLILDNAPGADPVLPLLPAGSRCATIVTSRRVLAKIDGATHLDLDVLPEEHAIGLLASVAGRERLDGHEAAARLVARLCDRLPLALRIIGARLACRPGWTLADMADRLADPSTRLDELSYEELSVRDCLRETYQALHDSPKALDRDAARAFRMLGHLEGFEVSVTDAGTMLDQPEPVTEAILERLVDVRLLVEPHPMLYQLRSLTSLYALEQSERHDDPEDVWRARQRLAATTDRAMRHGRSA